MVVLALPLVYVGGLGLGYGEWTEALPFLVGAAVLFWIGVRCVWKERRERRLSGVRANTMRVSRKVWFFFAAVLLGVGVRQATGQVLQVRYYDGPTVQCGNALGMVFADEYHEDVGGPTDPHPSNDILFITHFNEDGSRTSDWEVVPDSNTEAFCLRDGREAAREAFSLVMVSAVLVFLGVRFGKAGQQT